MADTVQSMLEAEIDDELGYSKYDYQNKDTSNSRNGYYPKTITASDSEFVVDWHELSSFFKYPPELRKLIYTTNSIENFNR